MKHSLFETTRKAIKNPGVKIHHILTLAFILLTFMLLNSCDKEVETAGTETSKPEIKAQNNELEIYFPFSGHSIEQISKVSYDVHGARFVNDRFGKPKSALCFTDNYMDLDVNLTDTVGSLSFWINIYDRGNNPVFFKGEDGSIVPAQYGIYMGGYSTLWAHGREGSWRIETGPPYGNIVEENKWSHIVLRWKLSLGKAELYVNNQLKASVAYPDTTYNELNARAQVNQEENPIVSRVGRWAQYRTGYEYLNGSLDEIRRYSDWLSDEDIAKLYNATK